MLEVDVLKIKNKIDDLGIKQKTIADRTGISESKLSLSLQEKRKLSVGEYASICIFLKADFKEFLKEV
jgi:transcriptional regulator with XRE-family HTH domain